MIEFSILLVVLGAVYILVVLFAMFRHTRGGSLYTPFHKRLQLDGHEVDVASWDGGQNWHRVLIDIGGHMEPQKEIHDIVIRMADDGISQLLSHIDEQGPIRVNTPDLENFLKQYGVAVPFWNTMF